MMEHGKSIQSADQDMLSPAVSLRCYRSRRIVLAFAIPLIVCCYQIDCWLMIGEFYHYYYWPTCYEIQSGNATVEDLYATLIRIENCLERSVYLGKSDRVEKVLQSILKAHQSNFGTTYSNKSAKSYSRSLDMSHHRRIATARSRNPTLVAVDKIISHPCLVVPLSEYHLSGISNFSQYQSALYYSDSVQSAIKSHSISGICGWSLPSSVIPTALFIVEPSNSVIGPSFSKSGLAGRPILSSDRAIIFDSGVVVAVSFCGSRAIWNTQLPVNSSSGTSLCLFRNTNVSSVIMKQEADNGSSLHATENDNVISAMSDGGGSYFDDGTSSVYSNSQMDESALTGDGASIADEQNPRRRRRRSSRRKKNVDRYLEQQRTLDSVQEETVDEPFFVSGPESSDVEQSTAAFAKVSMDYSSLTRTAPTDSRSITTDPSFARSIMKSNDRKELGVDLSQSMRHAASDEAPVVVEHTSVSSFSPLASVTSNANEMGSTRNASSSETLLARRMEEFYTLDSSSSAVSMKRNEDLHIDQSTWSRNHQSTSPNTSLSSSLKSTDSGVPQVSMLTLLLKKKRQQKQSVDELDHIVASQMQSFDKDNEEVEDHQLSCSSGNAMMPELLFGNADYSYNSRSLLSQPTPPSRPMAPRPLFSSTSKRNDPPADSSVTLKKDGEDDNKVDVSERGDSSSSTMYIW